MSHPMLAGKDPAPPDGGDASPGQQLALFPLPGRPPRPPSTRALARRFAEFSKRHPEWQGASLGDAEALADAFLADAGTRQRSSPVFPHAAAASYIRRRLALRLVREGKLSSDELPPDLVDQVRRRELRALIHETLNRHLKQVRAELEASVQAGNPDPIPALLAKYGEELRRFLDEHLDVL